MDSQDTAKTPAPTFLSFPPEIRLEIYRHLLDDSPTIAPKVLPNPDDNSQPQVQRASSNSRTHSAKDFRPASTILRTCRQIYLEAMPVLYGENTFSYSCNVSIFNPHDSSKVGFPDLYIQQIKHLELQVQPKLSAEDRFRFDIGPTIQHFVDRGCEVQTFELSLESDDRYVDYDDYTAFEDSEDWLLAHSNELLTALLGLKVSEALTISLSFSQRGCAMVNDAAVSGLFQDHLIKSLASQKDFTFTEKVDFDTEFLGDIKVHDREVDEDDKDDGSEDSENFNEDDEDSYVIWYFFSWCLRPHHAKAQTDNASA